MHAVLNALFMRSFAFLLVACLTAMWLPLGCVDPQAVDLKANVNVVVVDGTITNLAEPQIIRLNRSKADPFTGRFGTLPLTGAKVEIVVDSAQVYALEETRDGTYQITSGLVGQVGHTYQLRFTLIDGTHYESTSEMMQAVPAIRQVTAQFNPNSLSPTQRLQGVYAGAHDFYVDTQDPADQHNYYRWDWTLWEKQELCRTCADGLYLVYDPTDTYLYEACFDVSSFLSLGQHFVFDYPCRSACWDIFYGSAINVFDDQYSNGGVIQGRMVAQIPFYQRDPCLVEIRQAGLTQSAYRYFKLFQDQTQNSGGLADTPPSALAGNVHNRANADEYVIGYFTAGAVSSVRYWLDRKDTQGNAPGLFQLVYGRDPIQEPTPPPFGIFSKYYSRPPTALCVPSDSRTPFKPEGWRD
ncbi:MAG TPA: DUF4249 domain-containing protein [Spirosoma sp.]|jgi:hypothetical protein|nr:DUF4249 domain-containing protein [Spirosoma sp.]